MTTRYSLIRHGLTTWNLEHRLQGKQDIPLCAEGRAQVTSWEPALKQEKIEHIVSSPLKRSRETATIIGRFLNIGVTIEPNIREQDFGRWQAMTLGQITDRFPRALAEEEKKGWQFCPPGGEGRLQVLKRAITALEQIGRDFRGQSILVVTHQSIIKALVYHLLNKKYIPQDPVLLHPCYLHRIQAAPARARLTPNALALRAEIMGHTPKVKKEGCP
jgi:probable phosphoglycerate mutase